MSPSPRIAHVSATVALRRGGVSSAVLDTCGALALAGVDVVLCAVCPPGDEPEVRARLGGARTEFVSRASGRGFSAGLAVRAALQRAHAAKPLSAVHVHGLWLPSTLLTSLWALGRGIPLVTSTHGMLMPWAFAHAGWKKKPLWWLGQRRVLRRSRRLYCTSEAEREGLRAFGLEERAEIIPNGLPKPLEGVRPIQARQPRRALFLGRKHRVKNLDGFLRAWAAAAPAGWELVMVGADEGGHEAELRALANSLGISDRVHFHGDCYGEEKLRLIGESDLLVLPSHMENFGIVVAEALSAGRPALVSTGAPWSSLVEQRCGWWVKPDGWVEALRDATARPAEELAAMGARGAALVRDRYLLPAIAGRYAASYGTL